MTFEEWWEQNYTKLGDGQPAVFNLAFKEVAQSAWENALSSNKLLGFPVVINENIAPSHIELGDFEILRKYPVRIRVFEETVIPYECKGCKKEFGNGFNNRSASDQTCPHCGAVNETYTDWTWERGVNGGDEYPFGVTTEVKK